MHRNKAFFSKAVRAVARCCHAPKQVHWKAALNIVRYLKPTSHFGITFFQQGMIVVFDLEVLADTDYGTKSTATDRRSISGGIVMCGRR